LTVLSPAAPYTVEANCISVLRLLDSQKMRMACLLLYQAYQLRLQSPLVAV
jgi:hypothetical protein